MNVKETLEKLEGNEVIDYLNEHFKEGYLSVMELFDDTDKDEYFNLCGECNGMTYDYRGKNFCDVHKVVEGNTYDLKVLYALDVAVGYNLSTKQWVRYYDDMGED